MHMSSLNKVLSRRSSLLYHCCCIALPLQSYLLRPAVSLALGYPYHSSFLHPTQHQISLSKLAMSSSTNDNNSSNNDSTNLPRVDFTKTETVGTTRWMRLETLSYHVEPDKDNDNDDGLRKWDRAVRTTKQSGTFCYCVCIANLLHVLYCICCIDVVYFIAAYICNTLIVKSLCIRYYAHITYIALIFRFDIQRIQ